MCIPCVMCGACMKSNNGDQPIKDKCPECGNPVGPDDMVCPHCFTFLYKKQKPLPVKFPTTTTVK